MAAEEIRPPPAPSLYSRPSRQSGRLLGGDVARAPARPLPGGARSKRREERGELPGRPRPPMGEAAGGESRGSGGEQWRRHMGEPGRDLHRGAPGEEQGGAGGRAERTGAIKRASPVRSKSPRRRRATIPLAWRAFCVARPIRPTPVLRPQSPSAEPRRRRLGPPGCSGKKAACTRSCSALARPPARRTRVLSSRRTRDDPLGGGGCSAVAAGRCRLGGGIGCRVAAVRVRAASPAGCGRGGGRGLLG